MAFVRPTLPDLVSRIQLDLISRLGLVGAVARRSVVYVLARVLAGAAHMMHGHLEFLGRQLFPDTSEAEFLERQAAVFGVSRLPPTFASGTVEFTGTAGVVIPAGAVLRNAAGYEYEVEAAVTIDVAATAGTVNARTAGAAPSLTVGMVLSFESPIAGVTSTATVTSVVDGTDEEAVESLRTRLLERLAAAPHGGTSADYVAWAKEVAGVTRVWVTPWGLGPGTVLVRFVRDGDASPIPDVGEVAEVQAKLDEEKPAHASVTVAAPVAVPLDLTLEIVPDTAELRDAVEAQVADLLTTEGEPGATILLSALRTAIGSTAGLTDYTLTAPAANVTHAAHELPTLGTITWS